MEKTAWYNSWLGNKDVIASMPNLALKGRIPLRARLYQPLEGVCSLVSRYSPAIERNTFSLCQVLPAITRSVYSFQWLCYTSNQKECVLPSMAGLDLPLKGVHKPLPWLVKLGHQSEFPLDGWVAPAIKRSTHSL